MYQRFRNEDFAICCPYHEDNHPSCSINLQKSCWYCFVCEKGGALVDLIAELEGVTYLQAAVLLAQLEAKNENYFDAEDPKSRQQILQEQLQRTKEAHTFYQSLPVVAWEKENHGYLFQERGFEARVLRDFRVKVNAFGNYPLIFPLFSDGFFVGYTARCLGDMKPKYKNNPGFPRTQLLLSRRKIQPGPVFVVEGWLDKMMSSQHDFQNTTALLHWKISSRQFKMLSRQATEIISGLDNDSCGEQGHEELCRLAFLANIPITRYAFPEGIKDIGGIKEKRLFWKGMKERKEEKRTFAGYKS